ncbi:hypothetical protein C4546_02445 [Candidatus Parcubacteria bacterium]|jgi:hypothetical protein|nr:MAG: hypothetical protein C4546_02445 [Candidatus Parcubacteria bacterium]
MRSAVAWSNLTFIAVGLLTIFLSRKSKRTLTWWFGPIFILMGLSSFYHHSSYTEFSKTLDLGTIFLFSSLLVILELRRYRPQIKNSSLAWIYATVNLVSWALMCAVNAIIGLNIGIPILGVHIAAALSCEALCWSKAQNPLRLGWILATILIASIAANFWVLDFVKLAGQNHTNAHAVWHFLTAISLGLLYNHFKQFSVNFLRAEP